MTLHTTSNPNNRAFRTQMSRIDWGDLKSSFTASFAGYSGDRNARTTPGNTMESAAAVVALSYGAHDDSSTNRYAPSRYDPSTMDRVVDININDTQYDSDMSEDTKKAGVEGTARRQRWTKVMFATGGIILAASVAIGVLVMQNPRYSILTLWNNSDGRGAGANFQVAYEAPEQQRLLEISQEVLSACSESKLNEDISECQHLCRYKLCCFEKEKYNCVNDEEKECAVYAGCEALMEGVHSVDKSVKWG